MAVLAENQQDFLAQVNDDIRDCSETAVRAALRSPDNIERWMLTLKKMKRDTESQLTADRAERSEERVKHLEVGNQLGWLRYLAKRDRWRADAIRFKNGVENKLDEAVMLHDNYLTLLYEGIKEHQTNVEADDGTVNCSLFDERLWRLING